MRCRASPTRYSHYTTACANATWHIKAKAHDDDDGNYEWTKQEKETKYGQCDVKYMLYGVLYECNDMMTWCMCGLPG